MKGSESLAVFVKRHLVFNVQCRGHCDALASFTFLPTEESRVVGAYCCPNGFVSRVVYFSLRPDLGWFHTFLSAQLGREIVERRDLRVATRYGWELSEEAADELGKLVHEAEGVKEVYWTRYPKTDAEKGKGVFLCSDLGQVRGCGKLFVQESASKVKLCHQCRFSR